MVMRDFLREEVKKLSGRPSAALFEVEILAAHVLGISRSSLLTHAHDPISAENAQQISALVNRRAKGEPSAYLTGEKEFMGIPFFVGEGVLIPRPDTETLVEWVLSAYSDASPRVLDICTGSGCIAISIAHALPNATVTGYDISDTALAYAQKNNQRNGTQVVFVKRDILTESIDSEYDLIVSNPPYIPHEEIARLMPDVKDFEPHLALDGGEDGLDFYPILAKKAKEALAPAGCLAVEIGFDQGNAVSAIFREFFPQVEVLQDLAGCDRVVIGKKCSK